MTQPNLDCIADPDLVPTNFDELRVQLKKKVPTIATVREKKERETAAECDKQIVSTVRKPKGEKKSDELIRQWYDDFNALGKSGLIGVVPKEFRKRYPAPGITWDEFCASDLSAAVGVFSDFVSNKK